MAEASNEFAKKLAAIKESYVNEALPSQLQAVSVSATHFMAATSRESAVEALSQLHAASHKLAGSSGTFGLPKMSVAARSLSDFTDTDGPVNVENYQQHRAEVMTLVEAVAQIDVADDLSI